MKRILFILLGLLSLSAMAASEKRPYVPPYTYEKYHITYQVRADGAYESTTEVQLKINTPQGIRLGGSQTVEYINSQDEVLSIEAWTIQPDGTKVMVPEASIRTQDEQAEESAGGCAGFCVNGQSPWGTGPIVRNHNDHQETRSP